MKKTIFFFLVVSQFCLLNAQQKFNFSSNELLTFRVSYSIFSAAYATIRISEELHEEKPHFRVVGLGRSSGALSLFCKIDDRYETYIDRETTRPSKFVRKISECGYKKDLMQLFDFDKNEVKIWNKENNTVAKHKITDSTQDLISAFYKLRNIENSKIKEGEFISLDIFVDDEIYPFKLKIIKRERIKTKFGKINAIKIIPYVQNGRIFKANEGVTAWISDDQNHVPLKIEAELKVGTIKVSLDKFENVKFPLNFK